MWFEQDFFKYAIGTILALLIILLLYHVAPVFYPVLWFAAAIILPILFSTLLYYILRPVILLLSRWIPRYASILLFYFIIGILIGVIFLAIGPKLFDEANSILNIPSDKIESLKTTVSDFIEHLKNQLSIAEVPAISNLLISSVQKINELLSHAIINTITTLASIAIALALTPFVLFYFLRDDDLFSSFILRYTPKDFQQETQKILSDIDSTLSNFILGQLTIACIIGLMLFCGYLIIGLPHALALALFGMIFYIIPILGTFIAIIPALIVGLTIGPFMVFKVVLTMLIIHFLETNIVTPRLMSQRLQIHPLTIIFLLLAAGSLYGLFGLLLVTPTYAIIKVIIWNFYKITRLRYAIAKSKENLENPSSKDLLPQ